MNKSSISKIISSELTPYASAILLDPEYGLPAAEVRDKNAGLLLAYEKLVTMLQLQDVYRIFYLFGL